MSEKGFLEAKAGETGEEIEVTEAMVEAGVDTVMTVDLGCVTENEMRELLARAFREMLRASPLYRRGMPLRAS
jgi:hypothetical protein